MKVFGEDFSGNRSTTSLLFFVSILVIVIASINFVNFSTAMAPLRIRGLNTRLVFGKPKSDLRRMLIAEAVGISFIAYLLSLLWVFCFDNSSASELIRANSTSILDNLPVVLESGVMALVVGAIAGIYPAFYCTGFSAALVLKGSGMGSVQGKWLRLVLVGFQYIVSLTLIIAAIFVAVQNSYLRNFPLGFEKENIFLLDISQSSENDRNLLTEKLKQNPAIKDVTFSWGVLGEGYGMTTTIKMAGENISVHALPVNHNFLKLFSIPIIEGRDFVASDITIKNPSSRGFFIDDSQTKLIFNKKAQQMYGIKVDSIYDNSLCIGICDNINTRSLYNEYEPMGFALMNLLGKAYIKTSGGNIDDLYKFIERCYTEINLGKDFDCRFLDDVLQEQYVAEKNLSQLVNLFTGLAILLSLIGVFGLIVFETQYRRREVGLRKIYGSTVTQILLRFNRKFLIIIIICFFIAMPLTWWGVNQWLMTFAFRTQIHWWVFVVALFVVIAITIATITIQSWRAATENPIKSLRNNS